MCIVIEDNFEDVLSKAATGLGYSVSNLAQAAKLSEAQVHALMRGEFDTVAIRALAPVLSLNTAKLIAMASSAPWRPERLGGAGLRCFNTPFPVPGYEEMTVNNYLLWDQATGEGCIFDTGADTSELLSFIQSEGVNVRALFLTHTHRDHVAAYQSLIDGCSPDRVYSPSLERLQQTEAVEHGDTFDVGSLSIEARLTNGHSPGGTSFIVGGLDCPVAVVGDSLFCLSMGKAHTAYAQALKNNREQLLTLPGETILCPGHGPMTTVDNELKHNPFF